MHPIFLKNIKDPITFPLATLFQKSLNEGIVTSQWLEAYISPIYKKDNKKYVWELQTSQFDLRSL